MPFGPVDPTLDLVALEEDALARWRTDDLPAAVVAARADGDPWIFYEGPPTANGLPGLHHVWARVFKDIYPRFQTMRGRRVPRKGGWDCHGLPVELAVETELGLSSKHEIEAYGIAAFNERCRASVQRHVEGWSALTSRSGTWIDTTDAYWTLSNDYIESVWWLVRQMWDNGLLYEGHRVVPYCGRCGTALSSHEVAQGYEDIVDPSLYVRFPIVDGPAAAVGADLLVWTTTPWTLVSNVAAAVGPDIDYVRVRVDDGADLIMAAAARHRRDPHSEVVATFTGEDLVAARYRRPFDVLALDGGERVVAADFVTTDDGSGVVHLAPAFGEDDAAVGRAEGLPVLNPVDEDGAFDHTVAAYTGRFVRDANPDIIDDLAARGLVVAEEPFEHSYPHCWRCGTPLIYWAKVSWFARTSERRTEMVRENDTIGWHPEHIKHGRFGNWIKNNVDWALSRDRYWGTPLPIWRCTGCGTDTCIGSVAELGELAGRDVSDVDLHRPYVDDITFPCPSCAATARRLPPVLDAWFDSGSMPAAQHHHLGGSALPPAFPADFICEAIDQTRGWFYSLLAVNTLVFDATPYRNVVCLGHIVDEHGRKMSKSKGNVIDPWDVFERFGADALRWYFFSSGQPWAQRRVSDEGIRESTRQTLITLWNVWGFFATYADLDGWTPGDDDPEPTHVLDRWVLGELDDTVATVTAALDDFDALVASARIARFVDDLSNWYLRRSRPRFWDADDRAAHATLHRCLETTARLLAPFCPFLADELYGGLGDGTSVHLADWPVSHGSTDADLAAAMAATSQVVVLGRLARSEARIRTRQPLGHARITHPTVTLGDELVAEIAAELNVKVVEQVESLAGLVTWEVIPNFRALGPRLGAKVNEVKAGLAAADGSALKVALDADGHITVAGETLAAEEVEVRAVRSEELSLQEDRGVAIALDLELDDDLRTEGLARELVRAVNDLRKDHGLAIADRIRLGLTGDDAVVRAIAAHGERVRAETLAVELVDVVDGEDVADRTLDLDGAAARLTLARVVAG